MSEVIAFANNQVILSYDGATTVIYTDPVPLNGYDRGTADLYIEYLFNSASPGLTYVAQVSNDGTNWVDAALTDNKNVTGLSALTAALNGAFVRFKISFKAASSVVAACSFDLHVLFDHI